MFRGVEMKDQTTCIHYFILPSPDGEECIGVCKHCGFTQMHKNSFGRSKWSWGWQHRKDVVNVKTI